MFTRALCIASLFCFAVVAGAGETPPEPINETMKDQASEVWRERRLAYGKNVYDHACAVCHDEGLNGAPPIGDREAWVGRSPLWSAVLFEHSREGYLDMPARGTHADLTDQEVDAAAEYLLSETFLKCHWIDPARILRQEHPI